MALYYVPHFTKYVQNAKGEKLVHHVFRNDSGAYFCRTMAPEYRVMVTGRNGARFSHPVHGSVFCSVLACGPYCDHNSNNTNKNARKRIRRKKRAQEEKFRGCCAAMHNVLNLDFTDTDLRFMALEY